MSHRIFIVEDHPLMREMIAMLISREPDFELCGVAGSGEEALPRLADAIPDVILLDMSLPGMNGAELVQRVRQQRPDLCCLILSGHGEAGYVRKALEAGAGGYIMKGRPLEIPGAIREVIAGGCFLSPQLGFQPASASSMG